MEHSKTSGKEAAAFCNPVVGSNFMQRRRKQSFTCAQLRTPFSAQTASRKCKTTAVTDSQPLSHSGSDHDVVVPPNATDEFTIVDQNSGQIELENKLASEHDGDSLGDNPSDDSEGPSWYSVVEPVGKEDSVSTRSAEPQNNGPDDQPLDLSVLDGAGRQMLIDNSYNHVVDIDIEEGGVLENDEDNNDLFCGVGLDALIESETLLNNLEKEMDIHTATHVQLAAIPRVLDDKDLVIQSHTGTGKTLAFLLPLLDQIDVSRDSTQVVVIAPTRELAMQISRECDRLIVGMEVRNLALIGGANPARQVDKLRRRTPHIVVGTPGRLAELHEHRELNLGSVRTIVIDEVDQCVKDVFVEHVIYVIRAAGNRAQKILVSATGDVDSVRKFSGEFLYKPVLLRVGGAQKVPKNMAHFACIVPGRLRIETVRKILHSEPKPERMIIFVDNPRRVDLVVEGLYRMKVGAGALRGNAHKLERAEVVSAFRKGKVDILVTTEVAARGLDVKEISHVVNLDLPTDGDHYVHRAGRCGRAGKMGVVVNIATGETAFVVGKLAREIGVNILPMEPRGGAYRVPLEREPRERKVRAASSTSTKPLKTPVAKVSAHDVSGDTGSKSVESGSGRVANQLDLLRDAIERGDGDALEKSFMANGGMGDLADMRQVKAERREDGKEQGKGKLKKKGKLKAKAKAKNEAKQKAKSKAEKKKQKEKRESEARGPAASQQKQRRRPATMAERARSEGWVGNREGREETKAMAQDE